MITHYTLPYPAPKIIHKEIVLVGGCFDVLHYGHVTFLKQAKSLGKTLVVALESDEAIATSKKRLPFHTQQQRAEILDSLSAVDEVLMLPVLTTDEAYLELVKAIHPGFIAYTERDPYACQKDQQAHHIGAKSVAIPFEPGFSTTDVLERYSDAKKIPDVVPSFLD